MKPVPLEKWVAGPQVYLDVVGNKKISPVGNRTPVVKPTLYRLATLFMQKAFVSTEINMLIHERRGIYQLAERLLASQGLSSILLMS
jgi:hypothetical protein